MAKWLVFLLFLALAGCVAGPPDYRRTAVPDDASVWLGTQGEKGLWSPEPDAASVTVTALDGVPCRFPPASARWGALFPDLRGPFPLPVGAHQITLACFGRFTGFARPDNHPVQAKAGGNIAATFGSRHLYRVTAQWDPRPKVRTGVFTVRLWQIPDQADPDEVTEIASWILPGSEI